mgnify:CR=1 FL=1
MKEPVARSDLRLALGGAYYGTLRKLLWIKERSSFTRERCEAILPYSAASHKTPLMRRLRDVDMWMQENKVTNLRLASARVNGIVLHPGQTFSYWYLIGRPTARKGYLPGMLLRNGRAVAGVGGGLCQLSNLIFWMTLHTPLNPKILANMTRHTPLNWGALRKIDPQHSRKSHSHRSPRLRPQIRVPQQSRQMPDLPRRPPSRKHCGPGYAATTATKPRCSPRPRRRRSRRRYAPASPCRPRRRDRNRLPVRAGTTTPR